MLRENLEKGRFSCLIQFMNPWPFQSHEYTKKKSLGARKKLESNKEAQWGSPSSRNKGYTGISPSVGCCPLDQTWCHLIQPLRFKAEHDVSRVSDAEPNGIMSSQEDSIPTDGPIPLEPLLVLHAELHGKNTKFANSLQPSWLGSALSIFLSIFLFFFENGSELTQISRFHHAYSYYYFEYPKATIQFLLIQSGLMQ